MQKVIQVRTNERKYFRQYLELAAPTLKLREKERTGISTLKVSYNRVHGFYIEISKAQSDKAPADYVRRQTLKGAERFITPELKSFEDKVLSAKERALAKEKALYDELLDLLILQLIPLQKCATGLSELWLSK